MEKKVCDHSVLYLSRYFGDHEPVLPCLWCKIDRLTSELNVARTHWGWKPYRDAVLERDRLRATLEMINMLACYASEENIDSREQVLLRIGELARGEVSPEVPTAPRQPVETTAEQK